MLKDCKEVVDDAVTLAPSNERTEVSRLQGDIVRLNKQAKAIQELGTGTP